MAYAALPSDIRRRAQSAYALWRRDPRHPSLRFKKVGDVWSVRIGKSYRALAMLQDDTYYWFWIGTLDEYEQMLGESIVL